MEPVLSVEGICLKIGDLMILSAVDMTVGAGQVVGLIGSNGSGKSSLLNVISRYYRQTSGTVTLDGAEVSRLPPHSLAIRGVGRSFQSVGSVTGLTIYEYLCVGLEAHWGIGPGRTMFCLPSARRMEGNATKRVKEYARRTQLERYLDSPIERCPYGVRKIADVTRAILTGSRLLLLDEPSSGVSEADRRLIADVIRDVTADGDRAILIVDHDIEFVSNLASTLVALSAGTVIGRGLAADVLRTPEVVETFIGTETVESFDLYESGGH
jgi:branched-chain amino acid transport system ATP-binding protein